MSSSNCFLTCIQISQETGQVVWNSHVFQNFPQFIVIHTVKGFGVVNKAKVDVFLELSFSMSFIISHSLLKLMSIELMMLSNHLILCCLLLLPPSILPSIRVFSNESVLCIRWPKYWSFSFSIRPYSGLHIQDWFPLGWTGWISLHSKGLSRVLSNTTVQKHQFFGAQLSLQSNSHIHTWPPEKP